MTVLRVTLHETALTKAGAYAVGGSPQVQPRNFSNAEVAS
jgi:hypothetical protein